MKSFYRKRKSLTTSHELYKYALIFVPYMKNGIGITHNFLIEFKVHFINNPIPDAVNDAKFLKLGPRGKSTTIVLLN